jgi:hypothetical protein
VDWAKAGRAAREAAAADLRIERRERREGMVRVGKGLSGRERAGGGGISPEARVVVGEGWRKAGRPGSV